ncbi:MAG TPA: cytochrome c [Terriglobales bacterium]|nr:cytochrome c [Terriglobales bacterium]
MKYAVLVVFSLALIASGCKVNKPGSMEEKVMTEVKQEITVGGKDDQNPVPDTQANVEEGKGHFGHHCQICHGLDGQNTGVPFAQQMSPPVADLKSKAVQGYTDGQLHWIIVNGINPSGMPAWKGILEDDEMWKIVRYLRHLPAKGSLGTPEVFKEEEEEHQKMKAGAPQEHPAPHHHH